MRKVCALVACALLPLVACHHAPPSDPAGTETFKTAAQVLVQITGAPINAVPDAVLNRAQCVVIVPHNGGQEGRAADGAASCRDKFNRWQNPVVVNFTPARRAAGDILIFVLNERAGAQLLTNGLRLGGNAVDRPGPVVQQVATVTDAEMSADALSYEHSTGVTRGTLVAGVVMNRQNAGALAPTPKSAQQLERAITSFFNTITPVGIIIHHSAVIPGDAKVPENTREVDTFHRERGFEILCGGHEYHVAYHYLILPNGTVKQGRPERCEGAHARGYNSYLGIAMFGDFSSIDNPRGERGQMKPTPQQMRSLAQLCRRLIDRYHIPLQHVMRHSDVASTHCPGDRFPFTALLHVLQQPR